MILAILPYNVFAQVGNYALDTVDILDESDMLDEFDMLDEEMDSDELLDDLSDMDITTPVSLQLRNVQRNRTFDIQDINYKRSPRNLGLRYQSKWEGIAPYAPIFGHMVNDEKYTRPLGKEYGDLHL